MWFVLRAHGGRYPLIGVSFFISFLVIFLLVALKVTQSGDSALEIAINSATAPWVTPLMVAATNYGRDYFWILIVALLLIFGRTETKLLALELAVLFVAGIAAGEVMKLLYYRERPFLVLGNQINLLIPTDPDSSFPSGHALIVGIGAFFSFARIRNRVLAAVLIIEAALVCYSRVYVGAHYPTDVLGALALAGAITFIGIYLLEGPLRRYFTRACGLIVTIPKKLRAPEVV